MASHTVAPTQVTLRVAASLSSKNVVKGVPIVSKAVSKTARMSGVVCEARKSEVMEAIRNMEIPAAMRPALAVAVSNVLMAAPANAGVLFDFNLTLPIIVAQFLALMFVMDKLVYTPVGEVIDKRDGELRSKLMAVKDNSSELESLAAEANAILSAARNDANEAINAAKKKTEAECANQVAAAKKVLDAELKVAMTALESQKEESFASLEKSVDTLSNEIVAKILPA
mmetsp:Transcript_8687/g.11761  ORF Transcript_8687/g.11761 Transcript_8687/m.11761 type:complete len:227 (-) Transcript_8687:278-958(-)